ncbi:MAG TPA: maleylpyruvate isomerase family mycothiol-dependent enzyme [Pseudonocardiaceae bacterium]|jgi:uncharacterized protein (TIGR03083 family)|nr:maleylpyruvate isomerase family mycothiol-dependent enzyme [Pseudonocardiaceae bacterium]
MDVDLLITALHDQGLLLGDAADRAGLAAPVPTCPDWTVRELLLHIGGVHRWAATIVADRLTESPQFGGDKPADDELLDWYRAGHAHLVHTLRVAPADLTCFAFFAAPSPLAFWARRQAHETTMHRVDADRATGPGTSAPIDADLADDGIDELLTGFVGRRGRGLRAETDRTLHVHTTDADSHWLLRIGRDKPTAERVAGVEQADMSVSGPAELVYLALWHRAPWDGLTVTGDAEKVWSAGVRI